MSSAAEAPALRLVCRRYSTAVLQPAIHLAQAEAAFDPDGNEMDGARLTVVEVVHLPRRVVAPAVDHVVRGDGTGMEPSSTNRSEEQIA